MDATLKRLSDSGVSVMGPTLGMLIADVSVVSVGDQWADRVPMKLIYTVAAGNFVVLGIAKRVMR
jgi:putative Ca2+/H+ antiporter (TMEM165/GDT1 family)